MYRNLYLLRHAMAMDKMPDQQDIERQLNSIGLQNATRMGIHLLNNGVAFDIIIASHSERTKSTASLIAEQIKYDTSRIHINNDVYEASTRSLLKVINQLKPEWKNVLIVGHNPSVSYLSEYITKAEIGDMSTCGLCHIKFNKMSWEEVSEGTGELASHIYPDLLNF